MPISETSTLKLARVLLRKDQIQALEQLAAKRTADARAAGIRADVSVSEAAREVVAAGLGVLLCGLDSDFDTSDTDGRAA